MFLKQPPAILKSRLGKSRSKPLIALPELGKESDESALEPTTHEARATKKRFKNAKSDNNSTSETTNEAQKIFPDYYYLDYFSDVDGQSKYSSRKSDKFLNKEHVCQRLNNCKMADVESLTCLVEHCQRTFKECFTLAFHLSYSHIEDNCSSTDSNICLLCGKVCSNGRSLSLHTHLSHRDVSIRHSVEMRALSRLVDCQAAANRERMLTLQEKSKKFDLPDVDFPEMMRFPNYHPQTVCKQTTASSSKTRVVNLPLKLCSPAKRRQPENNNVLNDDDHRSSQRVPTEMYLPDDVEHSELDGRIENNERLAMASSMPVHIVIIADGGHRTPMADNGQHDFSFTDDNEGDFSTERITVETRYTNDVDDDRINIGQPTSPEFRQNLTKALQNAQASRNKMHLITQASTMTLSNLHHLNVSGSSGDGVTLEATKKRTLYDMQSSFDDVQYLPVNCTPKLIRRPDDERMSLVSEDVRSPNNGLSMEWSQDLDLN